MFLDLFYVAYVCNFYPHVRMHTTFLPGAHGSQEGNRCPGIGAASEPLRGCWKLNQGPL